MVTKAIRIVFLTVGGLGAGFLIADICNRFLGSPIYGFVLCPLIFNVLGRRWAGNQSDLEHPG